jgi:SPP1 gp7 family putative phage head morphogenesis protein
MAISKARLKALGEQLARQRKRAKKPQGVQDSPVQIARYTAAINREFTIPITKLLKEVLFPAMDAVLATDAMDAAPSTEAELLALATRLIAPFIGMTDRMESMAAEMANRVDKRNKTLFVKEIRRTIGVNIADILTDKGTRALINHSIKANVGLIKSIPREYLVRVRVALHTGFRKDTDAFSLKKEILKIGGIEGRRAKLIARDQISKLNGSLNGARQQDVGITEYIWDTVGDESVRESHAAHNGKRFSWNDPPADTGHPGQDVQCRCVANPVLTELIRKARGAA